MLTIPAPSPGVRASAPSSRLMVSPPHVPYIMIPKRPVDTTVDVTLIYRPETALTSSAIHAAMVSTPHPIASSFLVRHSALAVIYPSTSTPASSTRTFLRGRSLPPIHVRYLPSDPGSLSFRLRNRRLDKLLVCSGCHLRVHSKVNSPRSPGKSRSTLRDMGIREEVTPPFFFC